MALQPIPNYLGMVQGGQSPLEQITSQAQGLQGLQANRMALEQAEMQLAAQERSQQDAKMFQRAFSEQLQSGNPDYASLARQFPWQLDQIQKMQSFQNQIKGSGASQAAGQLLNALNRGDTEGAKAIIQQNAGVIDSIGDPSFTSQSAMNLADTNPEQLKQIATGTLLLSEGPEALLKATAPGVVDPLRAAEVDVKRESVEIRKEESKLRALEAQLKREDNDLKREELLNKIEQQELKISEQKGKVETAQQTREKGVQNAQEAAKIAQEILDDPSLPDITGTIAPRITTVRGESQDLINKANRLQSLLTVDNLKLMTGVLTDRDIQFLTNVASGLNITEGGILGSEKGVRRRLEEIVRKLGGVGEQQPAESQYREGQTATNPQTGERLIFRGGEWVEQ